jgi:hypothetical protein
VETSQDLFKQLEEAEKLFSNGSIKNAQKLVRDVISKTKTFKKVPNALKHKLNFAIGQSRYFDEMSSFATNPKREELISEITKIVATPLEEPKKQAHRIHDLQTKWQLLDLSSRPASREQWSKFNELCNKGWEPCSEYFDELKAIKINNANQRLKIIEEINLYVSENSAKWPEVRTLIQYMRGTFEQWQKFAPVLDKDLNKLKTAYFEAKKPINNYIKKQESNVIAIKESLILKVEAIDGEDGDLNIKKFNDLKNEWKKAGSAGRKHDNKLWDKFNKSADRLFNAKKEVIDAEIVLAENILKDLKDKTISTQDAETKLNELKNIQKTKEYNNVVSNIKNLKNEKIKEAKASKLSEYNKIFSVINDKKDATISLSKLIEAAISKSINNKKTDKKALLYSCIKLEILANLESLKKDAALRQQIQLEMLTSKFNKSNSGDLNDLDSLVINFIENYSKEDSGAPEKALWNRISKTLEVLVS